MSEELEKLKHKQYVAERKSRKVYDLDENGERIRPPSGNRKNHKEDKSYYRHFTVIILQNHIDAPTLPRYPLFQILLTKVVVLTVITTTFSGRLPRKNVPPATHPIHFAADSPDKIIAALRGRYFSFMGNAP